MTIVCSVQKAASKNPDPSYARNRCVYAPSTSSQSRFSGNLLDLGFRSTPDSTEMLAATKSEQLIDGNHRAHLGFSALVCAQISHMHNLDRKPADSMPPFPNSCKCRLRGVLGCVDPEHAVQMRTRPRVAQRLVFGPGQAAKQAP